ncbi:hypothetical protein IL306_003645 [Fusarium sp. DS 682]|nr:hypothetical protein IL306_003645 [Fusarium sp. DS 682]
MDSRELHLYFPFIDEEFMFATQPSRYISHLIGHEGCPGSIMSYIKSKGWANGLSAVHQVLRNDSIARAWWKKDDTFWVPRADVIVSLKTPLIYASAESNVKARLFSDLVRDALEEYSYDAELAGLQYNVSFDSRGLFLDVSGYNDKLPVLLEQVVTTMRDLHIKEDRYEIVRERLTRGYSNWQLQSSYHQVGDYTNWLNTPERDL